MAGGPRSYPSNLITLWDWDGRLERIPDTLYLAVRVPEEREASPTAAIIIHWLFHLLATRSVAI